MDSKVYQLENHGGSAWPHRTNGCLAQPCRTNGGLAWPSKTYGGLAWLRTQWTHIDSKACINLKTVFVCNRGDTIQYQGGLGSRKLGQAPLLLVFLTPRQALSSHPRQTDGLILLATG